MYLYLGNKQTKIDDKDFLVVSVLYCGDEGNFSVSRIYCQKTEEILSSLSFIDQFDDITQKITYKQRNDGKITLCLKLN